MHSKTTEDRDKYDEIIERLDRLTALVEKILGRPTIKYKKNRMSVGTAAALMGISVRELYRILKGEIRAPPGFPGLENEVGFLAWVKAHHVQKDFEKSVKARRSSLQWTSRR